MIKIYYYDSTLMPNNNNIAPSSQCPAHLGKQRRSSPWVDVGDNNCLAAPPLVYRPESYRW